jgi:hypothetical protein
LANVTEEHRIFVLEYYGSSEVQDGWSANEKITAIKCKILLKEFQKVFLFKLYSAFTHFDILLYSLAA